MRNGRRNPSLVAITGLLLAGCTLHFEPKVVEPPAAGSGPRVGGAVAVTAGAPDQRGRLQDVDPWTVELDYREFGEVAARQLEAELTRRGAATAAGAPKRIELVVLYVDILRTAGSFSCLVDYRVTLGEGSVRGLQVRDASWNYETSCQTALARVGEETLRDPVVAEYLDLLVDPPPARNP